LVTTIISPIKFAYDVYKGDALACLKDMLNFIKNNPQIGISILKNGIKISA